METVLEIINIIGIISFAAAGAMVAIDHETDLFGVLLLSLTTCFGGGLIRDIIGGQSIGRELPLVFTDMKMEIIVCILTAFSVFFIAMALKSRYVKEEAKVESINNILDALGIGVFTAAGTSAYHELGFFIAMFMGLLSSVGGSVTRDIILRTVPTILRKRIYALACLAGSAVYFCVVKFILPGAPSADLVGTICCIAVIFVIRICATVFRWNMPKAIDFNKIRQEDNTKLTK
jgi:uncharacterized membrane protein YeiH